MICTLEVDTVHFGDGLLGRFHVLATTLKVASSAEENPVPKAAPASIKAHAMMGHISTVAMSMAELAHAERLENRLQTDRHVLLILEKDEREAALEALKENESDEKEEKKQGQPDHARKLQSLDAGQPRAESSGEPSSSSGQEKAVAARKSSASSDDVRRSGPSKMSVISSINPMGDAALPRRTYSQTSVLEQQVR